MGFGEPIGLARCASACTVYHVLRGSAGFDRLVGRAQLALPRLGQCSDFGRGRQSASCLEFKWMGSPLRGAHVQNNATRFQRVYMHTSTFGEVTVPGR
jgi:hypothetical protein